MISKSLLIKNKLGLHARAASVFVKTASAFGSTISIANSDRQANGKSIMSVMLLQASIGTRVIVSATGSDEEAALKAIEQLIDDRFGEAE